MDETLTAKLSQALSQHEVERVWREERERVNLPNLLFKVEENRVMISVDPQHGGHVPLQEIKRAFQIAVHRKHGPDFVVEWTDGPPPTLHFSNRSRYGK